MKTLIDILLGQVGLIFDVDELLFDNWQEIFSAYESLLDTRNIAIDYNEMFPGKNLFDTIERIKNKYGIKDSTDLLAEERKREYLKLLYKTDGKIKHGVWHVFNHLYYNKPNIRLAYATSSEQVFTDIILEKVFQQCGIPQKDFFYTSTCWKPGMKKKPSPEIYLETISKLGLPAKQCIAFEDSKSGVESALAAGLEVIYVPSSTPICFDRVFEGAKIKILKSLNDYMPILRKL